MLRRLFTEPLLHFVGVALAIFAVYGLLHREDRQVQGRIVITTSKIEQLRAVFTLTRQRPPTVGELKELTDDYVTEEIYVREALALGLDKEDTVIRRRLRLKMEYLSDATIDARAPTIAELEAYLKQHPADFEVDSMLAFQQVFLNPLRRRQTIDQDAASILHALLTEPATDPNSFGDVSLLPPKLPLTRKASIGQTFGSDFVEALDRAAPGKWTGPVKSGFGVHLVRVSERKVSRIPVLAEVHAAVVREWANAKRKEVEDRRFQQLLKRYDVTIESLARAEANR